MKMNPPLAAKITGMMLKMDNPELLVLLESEARLKSKVDEIVQAIALKTGKTRKTAGFAELTGASEMRKEAQQKGRWKVEEEPRRQSCNRKGKRRLRHGEMQSVSRKGGKTDSINLPKGFI